MNIYVNLQTGGNNTNTENKNSFFAVFFRQKYINRWGLMRNVTPENLSVHAAEVSCLAHALATIGNNYFNRNYNADRAAVLALYHDLPEVFTGDLPTPVKYANDTLKQCYDELENQAVNRLIGSLPNELRSPYYDLLKYNDPDTELKKLVKAADKLCALIKCIEEEKSGNKDFSQARRSIEKALSESDLPELEYFKQNFLPAFEGTLDEI